MRWNAEITLLSAPEAYQDAEGSWHEGERVARTLMCNARKAGRYSLSTVSYHDRTDDTGLRPEAQVEIRAIDYQGEDRAIYRVFGTETAKEYLVISADDNGETCLLTLGRRIGNSETGEVGNG